MDRFYPLTLRLYSVKKKFISLINFAKYCSKKIFGVLYYFTFRATNVCRRSAVIGSAFFFCFMAEKPCFLSSISVNYINCIALNHISKCNIFQIYQLDMAYNWMVNNIIRRKHIFVKNIKIETLVSQHMFGLTFQSPFSGHFI